MRWFKYDTLIQPYSVSILKQTKTSDSGVNKKIA